MRRAAADLQGPLHKIAHLENSSRVDYADHDIDSVLLETLQFSKMRNGNEHAVDIKRVEALALSPARHVGVKSFPRLHEWREHFERAALHRRLYLFDDGGKTLLFHRQIAVRTKLRSGFREEQSQEMIHFRDGCDGRLSAAARDALLDGHARWQTGDKVDIWFFELLDELPRIGRHAVEKSSLAFREKNVESERRFAGAA